MERMMPPPLLAIEGLHVSYSTHEGAVPAVVECSLHVQPGECVGLVGESGCGKTTVAFAIMRYLGANGRIIGGRIVFKGRDPLQCSPRMLRQIRGADIAMVYQEPTAALNPSLTIGTQLREVLYYHRAMRQRQATAGIVQMLQEVRLADPERILAAYPYQLSGGQQQRLVIAMALRHRVSQRDGPVPQRPCLVLEGPVPSVVDPPRGCPFVTRCPRQFGMLCETERPPLQQVTATHSIACHIPLERLLQYSTVSSIEHE